MKKRTIIYLLLFLSFNSYSQQLFKDIATSNGSTDFMNEEFNTSFVSGDTLFFLANPNGANQGYKIWFKKDAINDASEILPNNSYNALKIFKFKNNIYFISQTGFQSYTIFKIAGNLIETVQTFSSLNIVLRIYEASDKFYFFSNSVNNDGKASLWASNGTSAGTQNIYTTTNNYINLYDKGVIFQNKFYFSASIPDVAAQFWTSDGTSLGTNIVKNDFTGNVKWGIFEMGVFNNELFFILTQNRDSDTGYNFRSVWKSDGTYSGTTMVFTGGQLAGMVKYKNHLVFSNQQPDYNYPWHTFIKMNLDNFSYTTYFTTYSNKHFVFNDNFYFITYNPTNVSSYQLRIVNDDFTFNNFVATLSDKISAAWVSIGSNQFYIQTESTIVNQPTYYYYKTYNLFVSDGTTNGTKVFSDLNSNIKVTDSKNAINLIGNTLYFNAFTKINGYELWQTNGVNTGTNLVKDINVKTVSSKPEIFTDFGDKILFFANDIEHGRELWSINTTNEDVKLELDLTHSSEKLEDISSTSKIDKNDFGTINNKLIYINPELHKIFSYDGINAPITLEDSWIDHTSEDDIFFTKYNGKLYYRSGRNTNNTGSELWATDGTPAGTTIIRDLNVGYNGSYPRNLIVLNSKLLFTIDSPPAICNTDGTTNGTLITQIFPNNLFILPYTGIVNSSKYFFSVYNFTTGQGELWTATENTVVKIKDVYVDNFSEKMLVINDIVYFKNANSPTPELWRSDGTTAGTYIIESLPNNSPRDLFSFNQNLYFTITEGQYTNIYKTDGSINGKIKVKTLDSSYSQTNTKKFLINANKFIFSLTQYYPQREEIWESDGTESGTKKIYTLRKDIPSISESGIFEFFLKNNILYFSVDDGINGKELWKMDLDCKNNLVINDTINTASNHLSGNIISANNAIKSTGNVTYSAKNSILLQAGTKIEQGAIFTAKIEGCNN